MFDRQSQGSLPLKMKKSSSSFEDTRTPEQPLVDGLKVDAGRELSLNLPWLLAVSAREVAVAAENKLLSPLSYSAMRSTRGMSGATHGSDPLCRICLFRALFVLFYFKIQQGCLHSKSSLPALYNEKHFLPAHLQ